VFYCSDGTLSVNEPEQENTGLVQGCIFKRQKVHSQRRQHTVFVLGRQRFIDPQVPRTGFKLNQAIITGKSVPQEYITPADLYRGAVINVFGTQITIVDADQAAEMWYAVVCCELLSCFAASRASLMASPGSLNTALILVPKPLKFPRTHSFQPAPCDQKVQAHYGIELFFWRWFHNRSFSSAYSRNGCKSGEKTHK
jgi:hypothetical protein